MISVINVSCGEGALTAPRNIADIILYDVHHEAEHIFEWWMLFRDQASLPHYH
jgi:hypothetical protein